MNILSSVIRKILKNPKLSRKLDDIRIIEIWDEIIGNNLQKYVIEMKENLEKIKENILNILWWKDQNL